MKSLRQQIIEESEMLCNGTGSDAYNRFLQMADWADDSIIVGQVSKNTAEGELLNANNKITSLEAQLKTCRKSLDLESQVKDLQAEIKRLREALEYYADLGEDVAIKALKALKALEKDDE